MATTPIGRYFGMETRRERLDNEARITLENGRRVREMHRAGRREADIAFPGEFF